MSHEPSHTAAGNAATPPPPLQESFALAALHALPAHVALLDTSGTILFLNQAWQTFARENRAALALPECGVGQNYLEICRRGAGPERDPTRKVLRGFEQVAAGRKEQYYQEYPCFPPGEQRARWFSIRITPFAGGGVAANARPHLMIVHEEIAARKGAELEGETSRQQIQELLERVNCLLWEADVQEVYDERGDHPMEFDPSRKTGLQWILHVVNEAEIPSWLPVAHAQGESLSQAWIKSRDPEDEIVMENVARDALQAGLPRYTQTFRNRMADGSVRWMMEDVRVEEITPEAAVGASEKPLRHWRLTGVVTEITERKQAEMASEASRVQLRQVMEQANCLLWQVEVIEIVSDKPYYIKFDEERGTCLNWGYLHVVNEVEAVRWLPVHQEPGEAFFIAWNRARHPADAPESHARSRNALAANADRYTQVFRTFVRTGGVRWLQEDVRVNLLPVTAGEVDEHGQTILRRWRLTGVVTDITERKLVEDRLKVLADDLRRSNAALQEFAYVASHDLKEPLRKIETFGSLLRRRAGRLLNEEANGYLDRMTGAANRMQALIQALLDYSRVTSQASLRSEVNLGLVARDVLVDLEARLVETPGHVEIGPLPILVADPVQMRQLMQNLIGNALKFRREEVPPLVTVTAEETPDRVRIRIQDNGIGFAPEYGERIFQLFERLAGRDGYEGSGVGLAICKKIVERHGGTITAEGRPGEGATFTVELPRVFEPGT